MNIEGLGCTGILPAFVVAWMERSAIQGEGGRYEGWVPGFRWCFIQAIKLPVIISTIGRNLKSTQ